MPVSISVGVHFLLGGIRVVYNIRVYNVSFGTMLYVAWKLSAIYA